MQTTECIRQVAYGKGYRQVDIAKCIGKSVATVSRVYSGKGAFDTNDIIKLCDELNIKMLFSSNGIQIIPIKRKIKF